MKNIPDGLNELSQLITGLSDFLGSGNNGEKEIIDFSFGLVQHSFNLLEIYNSEKLEQLKQKELAAFLRFNSYLKKFLDRVENYTAGISTALNSEYTSEIVAEISDLTGRIKEMQQALTGTLAGKDTTELEELEKEYKKLQLLLKEKEKLQKAQAELSKINLEELNGELEILSVKVHQTEKQVKPLLLEKVRLENQLINYEALETEVKQLKVDKNNSVSDLLTNIEKALAFISETHNDWNTSNDHYLTKLQDEAEKLKHTENEIKKYLTDISMYKNKYIKNKDIIEKHFSANKNIAESIPNLNESISDHLGKISDEISALDTKIKGFLEVNQKITDEVTNNPFLID